MESVDFTLCVLLLKIASLQLTMGLYKRVAQTVSMIHTVFGDQVGYKEPLSRADGILAIAITCDDYG